LLTNSSKKSNPCWLRIELLVLAVLLAGGCAEPVVPMIRPAPSERSKPGAANQALIVLPGGNTASVYLEYVYQSGRVWVQRVGVVNHRPDRVGVLFTKTRVYVDDATALRVLDHVKLNSRKKRIDFHILRDLPEGAKGEWLAVERRVLTPGVIRGPVIVLSYVYEGVEGFVKIPYDTLWDIPG